MKKDESAFFRIDGTASRESVYNFFSGTIFHVNEPPRIEAKVTMRTDQHDPDFFQDIIAKIQIRHIGSGWDHNVVTVSLDLLLICIPEDIVPWAHYYLEEGDKPGDKAFGCELMKIGIVIEEYAKAFAGLGAEPPGVAEAKEREEVRKFLTDEVEHHVNDFKLSVQMPVHDYDYEGFKDNRAIIEVERMDGSFFGRILTKMGRIYSFDIKTQFDALPITTKEAAVIEDHIRYQLLRFEALGPIPVITPDASYNATAPVNDGPEALHSLVTELERIVEEWGMTTDHPFPFVQKLEDNVLAKYRDPNGHNQEDLDKLVELSKRIVSQAQSQDTSNHLT